MTVVKTLFLFFFFLKRVYSSIDSGRSNPSYRVSSDQPVSSSEPQFGHAGVPTFTSTPQFGHANESTI
uniref:Uncharacterized protein n=1 Tax=uncultured verrucomicrobium HF0500_27H16 TaxID=723600 RepID=E7C5K1_9BACT|nr:hypothetical protein [uncultured verrucomicrobium HF0500_27H16]